MIIIISSFFRILSSFYLYDKLLNQNNFSKRNCHKYILVCFVLVISSYLFQVYFPLLSVIMLTLLFIASETIIFHTKLELSIIVSTLSLALSYMTHTFSSLLLALCITPFIQNINDVSYPIYVFISGMLTFFLVHIPFLNKRFKKGMPFLTNKKVIHFGVIFSICIFFLRTLDQAELIPTKQFSNIIVLSTILLAFLLFTWWRRQIAKSYIEKLRKLELESLYEEIKEKEKLIEKLKADNDSLARIIHKDNKLIPAMENAVCEYLTGQSRLNSPDLVSYGQQLVDELRVMSQDRKGILETYRQQEKALLPTGHCNIDAQLAYMEKKAINNHITFTFRHTSEAVTALLNVIPEANLTHILADLLENAIIATKDSERRQIRVQFGIFEKESFISVSDSGKAFDIPTLHSLGLNPHTTHEDSGGSGIGWMDIWKLKKKYRASIQIQEYNQNKDSYTKKITLSFNSKNHYVIQSYRHMDLINTQTRSDLYVIPYDNSTQIGGHGL